MSTLNESLAHLQHYMPHGMCYLWKPELITLHVVSDALIFLAYVSIPMFIFRLVTQRKDIDDSWALHLFSMFIFLCGLTHAFGIWVVWQPDYAAQGAIKAVTAVISVMTAFALWPLLPKLVNLPSPSQLLHEIDERKSAESALRAAHDELEYRVEERSAAAEASERAYRAVVEQAAVGIARVSPDGRWLSVNQKLCEIVGYSEDELVGIEFEDITHPGDFDLGQDNVDDVLLGKSSNYALEKRYVRKDGEPVWVHVTVSLVRDEAGAPDYFISVVEDISARKAMEHELIESRKRAEVANEEKSRFLAAMSHELRTPLNAIIGYSELLADESRERGDAAMLSDLERIESAGRQLLGLVNDVLDVSKVEAGRMELSLERFALEGLVEEVTATARPLVEANGSRLAVHPGAGLGDMESDPLKLRQILLNLLSNAAKFTEAGEVTLGVERDGERLSFEVRDTGMGMDEALLGRVFEPFVQGENDSVKRASGTGLGLMLTRKLCRLLGGEVAVQSAPGEGSVFTVWLPVRAAVPALEHDS